MKISIKREQNQASLSFAERLRVGELCSGMRKKFRPKVKNKLLLLLALLMTAATGAWAGTQATGYFESCTAYHGSIRVKGWAYDPDQTATSIQVHAYIWYGSSVGTSNDQRMPAVGINTDVYREDVNNSKGTTGNHGFDRYITVPAGTYTVQIYAIDKTGDGNPKIPGPNGNPATYTVTVTADPYNITYDANGGSGAPAAQQKGEYVKINLSAAEPTRAGYVFKEWNTKQDGSGISYAPGAAYTADGDATLYAKWEAIPYTVSLKDGVKDADKWTVKVGEATTFSALPLEGVAEGQTVTLKYSGDRQVKSVKATSDAGAAADDGNGLSKLTADYEAQDGEVLTGTLAANVKITIADGATVTLKDVNINGSGTWTSGNYAGITCAGDATITLEGTNTVKGFADGYPGIFVSSGKTLVINGTGELIASSNGTYDTGSGGAGIGGGDNLNCGNIEIQSGTVTATGNQYGAGIGGGQSANCGNITISGGTVTATGGNRAAGIGGGRRGTSGTKGGYDSGSCGNITISGGTITATGGDDAAGIGGGRGNNVNYKTSCGTITITSGVTSVTATKGSSADNSIGAGNVGTCGTVTIGGNVGAITTSPYTYQPSN